MRYIVTKSFRDVAQLDSADEKVTKCHIRGEVAVDEVNGASDN